MITVMLALAASITTAMATSSPQDTFSLTTQPTTIQVTVPQPPKITADCRDISSHLAQQQLIQSPHTLAFIEFLSTLPEGLVRDTQDQIQNDLLKGELYLTLNPEIDFSAHEDDFVRELKKITDAMAQAGFPLKSLSLNDLSFYKLQHKKNPYRSTNYDHIKIIPESPAWANFQRAEDSKRFDIKKHYWSRPLLSEVRERDSNFKFTPSSFATKLLSAFGVSEDSLAIFELNYR